MQREM
jgi:hypothetical protein